MEIKAVIYLVFGVIYLISMLWKKAQASKDALPKPVTISKPQPIQTRSYNRQLTNLPDPAYPQTMTAYLQADEIVDTPPLATIPESNSSILENYNLDPRSAFIGSVIFERKF